MQSKLLTKQSEFGYDMYNTDNSRRIGFSLETGIAQIDDWEIEIIISKDGVITLKLHDSVGISSVVRPSLDACKQTLVKRIQLFGDELNKTEYKDRSPLIIVKMIKQLDQHFKTIE